MIANQVTRGNFHHLMATNKYVVIAVLEQNKIGEMTAEMEEFREMLKLVAQKNVNRYRDFYQFGWTGTPDIANSVAMDTLSLPNLIVVNASSFQVKADAVSGGGENDIPTRSLFLA